MVVEHMRPGPRREAPDLYSKRPMASCGALITRGIAGRGHRQEIRQICPPSWLPSLRHCSRSSTSTSTAPTSPLYQLGASFESVRSLNPWLLPQTCPFVMSLALLSGVALCPPRLHPPTSMYHEHSSLNNHSHKHWHGRYGPLSCPALAGRPRFMTLR
ncbi:hypothetical protein BKA81DRAFT_18042 [Phyllosticta paracitricarpa]